MRLFASFILAGFLSLSAWSGDNIIHICLNNKSSSNEEQESHKRDLSDSEDEPEDEPEDRKKRRLNCCLRKLDQDLIEAASIFDLPAIKQFLAEGADINAADENGSVLHHAFENLIDAINSTEDEIPLFVLEFLIEQGADVLDAIFRDDIVTLLEAGSYLDEGNSDSDVEDDFIFSNYADKLLGIILSKINIHASNTQGKTPLMMLVQYCEPNLIQSLIDAGADIKAVDNSGTSVLEYALSAAGARPPVSILLVKSGALSHCSIENVKNSLDLANTAFQQTIALCSDKEEQLWVELINLISAQLTLNLLTAQEALFSQAALDWSSLPMEINKKILRHTLNIIDL